MNQGVTHKLDVALKDNCVLIKVRGWASFAVAPALKAFGIESIRNRYTLFMLDMLECASVDSTFMGVLAGLSLNLGKTTGDKGEIVLINLSDKINETFRTLGLDNMLELFITGETPDRLKAMAEQFGTTKNIAEDMPDKKTISKTMIAAHEDIIRAVPENTPRFRDLLEIMRNRHNNNEFDDHDNESESV